MKSFYVIWQNFNRKKFESYDIMPYLIREYTESEKKPVSFEEFKSFIKDKSMYQYWARCEYEILICGWPNEETCEKWDVYKQIMMNIDIITEILMENINSKN